MEHVLKKYVFVLFDDILIYSLTWHTHLHHLELVLLTLQQHQLYAWLSKWSFRLLEVEYLGHIALGASVAMEKGKIQAMLELPQPLNVK